MTARWLARSSPPDSVSPSGPPGPLRDPQHCAGAVQNPVPDCPDCISLILVRAVQFGTTVGDASDSHPLGEQRRCACAERGLGRMDVGARRPGFWSHPAIGGSRASAGMALRIRFILQPSCNNAACHIAMAGRRGLLRQGDRRPPLEVGKSVIRLGNPQSRRSNAHFRSIRRQSETSMPLGPRDSRTERSAFREGHWRHSTTLVKVIHCCIRSDGMVVEEAVYVAAATVSPADGHGSRSDALAQSRRTAAKELAK